MAERIDMLLRNEWEKYDEKGMKRKKLLIGTAFLLFLWIMFFLMVDTLLPEKDILGNAVCATGILAIAAILFVLKLRQMDIKKDGWYFSGLQDPRLRREEVLELVRNFLRSKGYVFTEEETHRTLTLWITYFTIPTADFRIRVWYATMADPHVVEIGIGPENRINRKLLEELRVEISEEFVKTYGIQKMENV